MAGVEVQTVATALDIHPFMLSRWRKEVRDGVLKGRARRVDVLSRPSREIKQLQALRREHALLKEEHELLKKAVRFSSERNGVELAPVVRSYIPYSNSVRLHSGIGYASPVNYEARAQ